MNKRIAIYHDYDGKPYAYMQLGDELGDTDIIIYSDGPVSIPIDIVIKYCGNIAFETPIGGEDEKYGDKYIRICPGIYKEAALSHDDSIKMRKCLSLFNELKSIIPGNKRSVVEWVELYYQIHSTTPPLHRLLYRIHVLEYEYPGFLLHVLRAVVVLPRFDSVHLSRHDVPFNINAHDVLAV